MNFIESFFLGVLQGIGEFLPISSSAHLTLFPFFINKPYQGLAFDVMLHIGTLLAIVIFFYSDWVKILKETLKDPYSPEGKKLFFLAIATIPAGVVGLSLEKYAETLFRTPIMVAASLIIFSIAIWIADRKAKTFKEEKEFSLKDAILIGLAQALAIIPGASRSGMTISAALMLGYKRFDAARISFLLSAPIILGAGILEMRKLDISSINYSLITAFVSSFIFGIISIKFLLSYLKKRGMGLFVIYRILLGTAVFAKYFFL